MAIQGGFFGRRDAEPAPARTGTGGLGGSGLGGSGTGGAGGSGAQPFGTPPAATSVTTPSTSVTPKAAAEGENSAQLTVGRDIKLKGVEITDCDTLLVEGTVEATMNSRLIDIAETGSFKGSAEIDIAEIRGRFDGDLKVRDKLIIYATGKVTGKVEYGSIVVEEGGQLSGEVTFGGGKSGDQKAIPTGSTKPPVNKV